MTGKTKGFFGTNEPFPANGARIMIFLSAAAILALGIWLRLYGYFTPSFFVDELWRAAVMNAPHPFQAMGRLLNPQAVGYIALDAVLARINDTEWVLKLTSLIPSVLSLLMIFLIGRRLFRSNVVRLYLLFVVAVNPVLVEYTKYLKPYALEMFVHLVLIYCTVVYMETRTRRVLLLTLAAGALSGLFAINSIFVLPSIYLILFYVNRTDRRGLMMTACGCLVSLILLFGHYLFIVSTIDLHKVVNMWITTDKNNIDTFYSGGLDIMQYLRWLTVSTVGLVKSATFTGILPSFGRSVRRLTEWFLLAGLFFLVKDRNYKLLLLLLLPLPLTLAFNIAGKWPYGLTRVNMFLTPYFLLVLGYGMDRVLSATTGKGAPYAVRRAWAAFRAILLVFLVFSILAQVPYTRERLKPDFIVQQGRLALEYLCSLRDVLPFGPGKPRIPLYLGANTLLDLDYYSNYDRGFSRKYGKFFRSAFIPLPPSNSGGISSTREDIAKVLTENPNVCFFYAWHQDYEERILKNLADSGAIKVLGSATYPHAFAMCGTSSLYSEHGSVNPEALSRAVLKTYPSYRIGAAVPLTFTGEGFDKSGFIDWYPLTADMRWTPDACPRILFRMGAEEDLGAAAVFRLTYSSMGNERIEVLINEVPAGTLSYAGSGDETKEVRFGANLLKRGELNIVRLKMSGAGFTEKDDVRHISMAFKSFAIVPAKQGEVYP